MKAQECDDSSRSGKLNLAAPNAATAGQVVSMSIIGRLQTSIGFTKEPNSPKDLYQSPFCSYILAQTILASCRKSHL